MYLGDSLKDGLITRNSSETNQTNHWRTTYCSFCKSTIQKWPALFQKVSFVPANSVLQKIQVYKIRIRCKGCVILGNWWNLIRLE